VIAYVGANLLVAFASGNIWIFSSTMLQNLCPNNFLGRVLSFDLGFNLNLGLTLALTVYGPVLYDVMNMTLKSLGAFQLGTGVFFALLSVVWWVVTMRNPNEMVPVDENGRDIQEDEFSESSSITPGLTSL
jgi:putative flippase GtrA